MSADGCWIKAPFLVDTGADCTVFSADIMNLLRLPPIESSDRVSGAGGAVSSVRVATELRLVFDSDKKATIQAQFVGCQHVDSLDMSVLGRDILDLFALIVDRQGDTICLVGPQHYYTINTR